MTELKTLKDLNLNVNEYSDAEYVVKQGAIKRLKKSRCPDCKSIDLMEFCNITEEELK